MSFRSVDPAILRQRYALVPSLRAYDALEPHLTPYVTLSSPPWHRSPVLNTDGEGFRVSKGPQGAEVSCATWGEHPRRALLLGGSFAFGVGASDDRTTLASRLSALGGEAVLNLGIRAGNSFQELIASVPFVHRAQRIYVVSGVNNLVAALQTRGRNEIFGPFFFEDPVDALRALPVHDVLERAWPMTWRARHAALRRALAPPGRPERGRGSSRRAPAGAPADSRDRMKEAAGRQMRDLTAVRGMAPPGVEVVFGVQPFLDDRIKDLSPEETALTTLHDSRQGARWMQIRQEALDLWPEYAALLADEASAQGVRTVEMSASRFGGWSFADRVHLVDHGYEQAATMLLEA